LKNELRF